MSRRTATWLAWSMCALSLALTALSLLLLTLNLSHPGVPIFDYWLENTVVAAGFSTVGAVVISRHPSNVIGWLLCTQGPTIGLNHFSTEYALYSLTAQPGSLPGAAVFTWLAYWVYVPALGSAIFLFLLFPTGRLPSSRWRWFAVFSVIATLVGTVCTSFSSGTGYLRPLPNPLGIESVGDLSLIVSPLLYILALLAVISMLGRLHRGTEIERQQIKWFAYAAAVTFIGGLVQHNLFPVIDVWWVWWVGFVIGTIGLLGQPVALGIAILRYRLYDIDVVINRTLVYGALTASVIGIYVLVVGYLSTLFQTDDLFVSLLATGLVTMLFAPLRDRLQRAVNHLMYGERDDPYAVVSRLGERLETTLALEAVLPTIVKTVREALKLPYAAIALPRNGSRFEVVATSGEEPPSDPLVLPLSYGGEPVGELLLAPRAPGESFSAADRRLLDGLARHASVAVHGVRVMADLQRSRERLVLSREEERRRLRRDLHDELAPTLAALGLSAATVGELIPTDPKEAALANEKLRAAIRATVGDIRRLVYDLRPPALDELGLVVAIKERASRLEAGEGLRVTVEAPEELPVLPAAVEVAAYRIAQEALTNVSRHARAGACFVRLACTGSHSRALTVEVTDDGEGLPDEPGGGVGLHSMRERAAELGGSCEIERSSPTGTRVFARLPIEASVLRQQEPSRSKGPEADA